MKLKFKNWGRTQFVSKMTQRGTVIQKVVLREKRKLNIKEEEIK